MGGNLSRCQQAGRTLTAFSFAAAAKSTEPRVVASPEGRSPRLKMKITELTPNGCSAIRFSGSLRSIKAQFLLPKIIAQALGSNVKGHTKNPPKLPSFRFKKIFNFFSQLGR